MRLGQQSTAEAKEGDRLWTQIPKLVVLRLSGRALHIRKEVVGHVANRLSTALYREVAYLIEQDVVSVADADAPVCMGPGLRWALMGPNLIYHLGGGRPGGIHHFLEHFTGSMTAYWADLGSPDLARPELQKKIVEGVLEEVNGRSFDALSQERDNLINDLSGVLHFFEGRSRSF